MKFSAKEARETAKGYYLKEMANAAMVGKTSIDFDENFSAFAEDIQSQGYQVNRMIHPPLTEEQIMRGFRAGKTSEEVAPKNFWRVSW